MVIFQNTDVAVTDSDRVLQSNQKQIIDPRMLVVMKSRSC